MGSENKSTEKVTIELFKMQPDAMLEFFEIDFSHLQSDFSFLEKKYKVSFSANGDPVYRFTSNINGSNPIRWQNKPYQPLPIDCQGFEVPSDGRLPRPKLRIANPSGLLSSIVAVNHDFHGCKVTRKRTFVKFLDDANFPKNQTQYRGVDGEMHDVTRNINSEGGNPFGSADPEAHLPDEIYYIYRKTVESRDGLEFELTSILEVDDVAFPGRQMLADHCSFRYRDTKTCNYRGLPVTSHEGKRFASYGVYLFNTFDFDGNRVPMSHSTVPSNWDIDGFYKKGDVVSFVTSKEPEVPSWFVCIKDHSPPSPNPPTSGEHWILDACSKTLEGCTKRFGGVCNNLTGPCLPFGGFPSVESFKHA